MILDFQKETQEAVCPHCGTALRYRLLDRFMFEIISESVALSDMDDDLPPAMCG
jgi:hypothetical protein